MHVAHLELSLQRIGDAQYSSELRYTPANSNAEVLLNLGCGGRPVVQLDYAGLAAAALDPTVYGQDLTRQVFAHAALRRGFLTARAHAAGAQARLRLHLRLDAHDPRLHALHWETLADPDLGGFLALSEHILLARAPASSDLVPLLPRPRPALRALVAVASPHDLAAHGLAPIDASAEVARATAALADIPASVLARGHGPTGATLAGLAAALRDGPDLLHLVAHGALRGGKPYLWLERADGASDRVRGEALVAQIAQLPQRPRLIVLVSCASAGAEGQHALAALGPQLAAAGVAAVIGMQGAVRMDTMARLLPTLFSELRRDGQIDRALAAARAAVRDQPDWWLPALFLRARDGLLWQPAATDARATAVRVAPAQPRSAATAAPGAASAAAAHARAARTWHGCVRRCAPGAASDANERRRADPAFSEPAALTGQPMPRQTAATVCGVAAWRARRRLAGPCPRLLSGLFR